MDEKRENDGVQMGERVPHNISNSGERVGGGSSLMFLKPVRDPSKSAGAGEESLTVGVLGGIQQAFLDAMGFKVSNNTLQRKEVRSSPVEVRHFTDVGVHNGISTTQNKHRL